MIRAALALVVVVVAGCAHPAPAPTTTPFARDFIDAADAADAAAAEEPASAPVPSAEPAERPAVRGRDDELAATLGGSAPPIDLTDDDRFASWLAEPRTADALMRAAWLRHPAVAAARAKHRAVAHRYDQAHYLADTVGRYRTFTRTQMQRIGPSGAAGTRAAESMLVPAPSIATLRERLATLATDDAWQRLRKTIVDRAADVLDATAALRLAANLERIATAHAALLGDLEPVVQRRVSAGHGSRADVLRIRAAIADLEREATVRAAERTHATTWLRTALACDGTPEVRLASAPRWAAPPAAADLERVARTDAPASRIAAIAEARADAAIALAERMTIPQVDLGSTRVERGMTGDAGDARTPMLTPTRPRVDVGPIGFAPTTAMLDELRERRAAAREHVRSVARDTTTAASAARTRVIDADARFAVHESRLVPLSRQAYDTLLGAYAGRRAAFVDVIRAAEERLRVDRGLAQAQHDATRARATLLRATGDARTIPFAPTAGDDR